MLTVTQYVGLTDTVPIIPPLPPSDRGVKQQTPADGPGWFEQFGELGEWWLPRITLGCPCTAAVIKFGFFPNP